MGLTTGVQISKGIQPTDPVPVDSWSGPYEALTEQDAKDLANYNIPISIRFKSMEVRLIVDGISKKYWYRDGVDDSDLIEFASGISENVLIISKTYAELKALKDANQLVVGQNYKIIDFRLAWWDYTVNNPQEILSNEIEPLIVTAITTNKFGTVAYSTLYPADIIYYDFDKTYGAWGKPGYGQFEPMPNTKGWITKRIGQQYGGDYTYGSVEAPYDWRHVTWNCRRVDISTIPEWSSTGTYSQRQIVKYYNKLFVSVSDNNTGRINDNGFIRDNPPGFLRGIFNSGLSYSIGDEVGYTLPSDGSIKYYRKTGAGAVGTLPTVTATWTEASLLSDFDFVNRKLGYAYYLGENELNFINPFYWVAVSPFVEGKTYFPTNEYSGDNQGSFQLQLPSKIYFRLPNDETPWYYVGSNNGSGTPKYSYNYGYPRLPWNYDIYYPNPSDYINLPWDLTTKAQKPTFASADPTTTNSNFNGIAAWDIKLGGYANVFYAGNGSGGQGDTSIGIDLGANSNFNIFKGRAYGLIAKDGFSNNKIGFYISDNTFGYGCRNNSIGSLSNGNVYGDSFIFNILGVNCKTNVFGSYCQNNIFGTASESNIIDSQFLSNFCVGWFYQNRVGGSTGGNIFSFYTSLNQFDGYCFNNTGIYSLNKIGKEFNNNFASAGVYGNVFGSANNNNFGTYFQNNQCSDTLHCCVFGVGTAKNKFSTVQYLISIGNLYYNEIDTATRLILGYNFIFNTIKPDTINNINSDFSFGSATLVYNNYPKQIFKNAAGIPRLSYYNSSDVLVVTSPTA